MAVVTTSTLLDAFMGPLLVSTLQRLGLQAPIQVLLVHEVSMLELVVGRPPLWLMQGAVAAVWLYEGLWCKLLGREPRQRDVVAAVPKLGAIVGRQFLLALGVVEVGLAVWVLSSALPGACAVAQVALLVLLNSAGVIFARHVIHDPAGMVVKNAAFLVLVWTTAALQAP